MRDATHHVATTRRNPQTTNRPLAQQPGLFQSLRVSRLLLVATACATLLLAGCRGFGPSNERMWSSDQTLLSTADFQGDRVTVHNIRNCAYTTADDYILRYYDQTFDLREIQSVDLIVIPFADMPQLAHVMLSFGFEGDKYVCISIEIRRERGETYSVSGALLSQFELMYVVGDERDLIQLRSIYRLDDVYVYRTRVTPEQARKMFVEMLQRANKLAASPEYYHVITNNCTTNVVNHINKLWPNRIAYNYQVLLPGYSDLLAYSLGLIETEGSFAETRAAARVNKRVYEHRDEPEFSRLIRER